MRFGQLIKERQWTAEEWHQREEIQMSSADLKAAYPKNSEGHGEYSNVKLIACLQLKQSSHSYITGPHSRYAQEDLTPAFSVW